MVSIRKYLFDLVVLFVGITAAFYVENFRTALGDKEDLKKYLIGLTDDLRSDSLIYVNTKATLENSKRSIDSLLFVLNYEGGNDSLEIRLLATSTLLIYDVGMDNNINYKALVNSGQLKLIDDIVYRKELKDYYRYTEVWLKDYETEFETFRANELFPFLNSKIDFGDFKWEGKLKISKTIKTDTKIFRTREFKNYLYRTRQYLHDFETTMSELKLANDELIRETKLKLE